MWTDALLVLSKDLRVERRTRELVFTMLAFGLLATLIFALSFFIDRQSAVAYAPGVIWIVLLFGGTLGLQRLFEGERDNDCLGGYLLSPADPRGLYLGKVMFLLLFMLVMELVTIPLVFLFFDLFELLNLETGLLIAAVCTLGTLGFAFVGTLFAASLLSMRMREVLLPIVVYPLVTPVLIAGVQSTRALLSGMDVANISGWLMILGAFDLIYLGLCLWLFPLMLRD